MIYLVNIAVNILIFLNTSFSARKCHAFVNMFHQPNIESKVIWG